MGRDRESTEGAARELRAASGGPVEVFVADLSAQAQVLIGREARKMRGAFGAAGHPETVESPPC